MLLLADTQVLRDSTGGSIVFCGTGACAWGFWTGVCILVAAAASAVVLLGFYLYRRIKKSSTASAAPQ